MDKLLLLVILATGISLFFNILFKKYDIPTVIGYIISGTIVSYLFNLRDTNLHTLYELAEFGIVFLMFMIGLEFSIKHLTKMKREVFLYGTLQVVSSTLLFFIISHFIFSISLKASLIVASALSLSSTAIVLKILTERKEITQDFGKNSVGILIFQDLAVIPILIMIGFFTQKEDISILLGKTLISAIIAFSLLYFMGKYLIAKFLEKIKHSNSEELFILSILLIVIFSATLVHILGLSYSLGAFFAGIMIAETKFKYKIEADLLPFRDILLGIFFVTVGMQISIPFLTSNIGNILLIMLAIMSLKAILIFGVVSLFDNKITAFKNALVLSQVGEFSFAVLELSRLNGLITKETNQTLIIAIVFSMVLTPFIIKNLSKIIFLLTKSESIHIDSSELKNHIVLIGYHKGLVEKIKELNTPYVIIENSQRVTKDGFNKHEPIILANPTRVILEKVSIKNASIIIISLINEDNIRLISETIYSLAPKANIVIKVKDETTKFLLDDLNVRGIVDENELISKAIFNLATNCNLKDKNV